MSLAVVSAVVFAVLFLVTAFWNVWALLTLIAIVMVIAILEVDAALRVAAPQREHPVRRPSVTLRPPTIAVLAGGVGMLSGAFVYGEAGQLAALVMTFVAVVACSLADHDDVRALRSASGVLLIALWIPFLASFLALLLRRPDGHWYIIITVALTAASDISAFAVGSRFGRSKLAPAVSPAKTWEGLAGGLIGAVVVAGIGAPLIVAQLSVGRAVALGALVSLVATVGDLAESAVKRSLGVKDLGHLLPGHGGMMDRVDAMLFTLPVAHFVLLAGGL